MKLAEGVHPEAQVPSVNELRYAGRRLIDALIAAEADPAGQECLDRLAEAKFFCHRARHDAIDAATSLISLRVDAMVDHLGYENVVRNFARLPELRQDLHKVRMLIARSRGDKEARDLIYKSISAVDFQDLIDLHADLMFNENIIRRSVSRKQRKEFFNNLVGIAGFIGLVVTIYVEIIEKHYPALAFF